VSSINFKGNKARPMPDFEKKAAQVKVNTAALKREGYQLEKERKE